MSKNGSGSLPSECTKETILTVKIPRLQRIIEKFSARPRLLFLTDGLGAWATAVVLVGVLARWETVFGMPLHVLYPLAAVACLFAFYSLSCYFLRIKNWRPFLILILTANLVYCVVSIGCLLYFKERITPPGFLYFFLEIMVVCVLVFIEWKVARPFARKFS